LGAFLLYIGCANDNKLENQSTISKLESKLYSDTVNRINFEIAKSLIDEYAKYTQLYPNDTMSPLYAFKAGELNLSMNLPKIAFGYFDQVATKFPQNRKSSFATFMKGFIYDGPLNDTALARKYYTEFLVKYPNHPLANDAQFSMKNLGKSDEELVEEFEDKLKASGQTIQ